MNKEVKIGDYTVGDAHPVFFAAEAGINHNGDIDIAKKLIDLACMAGCNIIKFQKRTPELCVPPDQRNKMRETPWGYISYMEYRHKVEFGLEEYTELDRYCHERNMLWFASCWDKQSLSFIEKFNVPCHKIPSAALTDIGLLKLFRETGRPLVLSTGMSTMDEIDMAVDVLGTENLIILHCTSTYPCPTEELNLSVIKTLKSRFNCPIGYSGHEEGLPTTVAAVALGACFVERHITLDRAMWGTDQAASVAPIALLRLVKHIHATKRALGDGVKRVWDSELPVRNKLRGDV